MRNTMEHEYIYLWRVTSIRNAVMSLFVVHDRNAIKFPTYGNRASRLFEVSESFRTTMRCYRSNFLCSLTKTLQKVGFSCRAVAAD